MHKPVLFSESIEDIEINGLRGRMFNLPARNKEAEKLDILYIHGHHSSIERLEGLLTLLGKYGNVCAPDMPGFGGMQPLRKIGQKPTIDNLADYMAAFIRLRYGTKKKFVVVGFSFGFVVLTRMLQKYPELQSRVILAVSVVGFLSGEEFVFKPVRMRIYRIACWVVETRLVSFVAREIILRKWFLGTIYTKMHNAKEKFKNVTGEMRKRYVDFEVFLWRINDLRTHAFTNGEFLRFNLLHDIQITSPLVHVAFTADQYFDGNMVNEHMKVAYTDVRILTVKSDSHAPTVVSGEEEAALTFPKELGTILESLR